MKNLYNYFLKQKKIFFLFLVVVFLFLTNIYPQKKNKSNWSDYRGQLTWEQAKSNCNKIGMRLPYIKELKNAFYSKLIFEWENDKFFYWTNDVKDEKHSFVFSTVEGNVSDEIIEFWAAVRCIKK